MSNAAGASHNNTPLPPVHIPRPYERPHAHCAARLAVATDDGAQIAVCVYAPDGVDDAPGSPFGLTCGVAPVLFLHGNGEEHGIFGPIIDAVVASGRSAIAIDSRAQGASTRGTAELTYELMAADAKAVCERLGANRVHIVGFSDGGILGLLLARDWASHVLTLTAIGANLCPEGLSDEDQHWMAEAAAANETWARDGYEGAITPEGHAVPSPREAAQIAELLRLMTKEPQITAVSLAAISCPTTVMAGELDDILPEETKRIAQAIAASRLVIVPQGEHNLPKTCPDVVARELLATIEKNDLRVAVGGLRDLTLPNAIEVRKVPATEEALREVEVFYARVCAEPATSGWTPGGWPLPEVLRDVVLKGQLWGAFSTASPKHSDGVLIGAMMLNNDDELGDGTAPGIGSHTGAPAWEALPAPQTCCVHLLAGDPTYRGQGVARALLAAAEREGKQAGAIVLRLATNTGNSGADALYAGWGMTNFRTVWCPYDTVDVPAWSTPWERRL